MILGRYVAVRMAFAFLAALAGVVFVFLAVDFVDNAAGFKGAGWGLVALELYANKAMGVVRQVSPAALLLGAGITASAFRHSREYTAMRSVGLGPWRLAGPIVAVGLAAGVALVLLHDVVGVRAAERAEEILALHFGRGGDLRRYKAAREPKRWFRGEDGRRIYHLRGTLPEGGFERVTVLEVTPEFRLVRRIDAGSMRPDGDGWVLSEVSDRTFHADGTASFDRRPSWRYTFPEPPEAFAVRPGRPSQMRWAVLLEQIRVRERLGLPAADFALERYNRLAYPLAGVPGALLAVALALRRNRKGHVSAALVESVGVSLLFWGVQGVTWAMGLSGHVEPWAAAWLPNVVFLAVGVWAVRRSA